MLEKFIHFIKYNNATVIILALVLILGGGVFAAEPEAIGEKQTSVQGYDNTALLSVDLDKFNMDFKIENIEQDEKYYYVTYGFLDLAAPDNAWQYQLSQRTQKISKKTNQDLGAYMAKFLVKHYEARTRELKREKELAQAQGEQKRIEVTEYSGLVGRVLDLAGKVFPGYEPVVKRELPAPDLPAPLAKVGEGEPLVSPQSGEDSLTKVYNDYVASHDKDSDGILDQADNCPETLNADQLDSDGDGLGDVCDTATSTPEQTETPADSTETPPADVAAPEAPDSLETPTIPEPTSVDIIELPATEPVAEEPVSEPTPEPTPESEPSPTPEITPAPESTPAPTPEPTAEPAQ